MTDSIKSQDYRHRAAMMRLKAEHTQSEKGRFVYLELAAYWDQLAEMTDKALSLRGVVAGERPLVDADLSWPPRPGQSEQTVRHDA